MAIVSFFNSGPSVNPSNSVIPEIPDPLNNQEQSREWIYVSLEKHQRELGFKMKIENTGLQCKRNPNMSSFSIGRPMVPRKP